MSAYFRFSLATYPDTQVHVPDGEEAQREALALIERGFCAYRNRDGLIRDVGLPIHPKRGGHVFEWADHRPMRKVVTP